jgi:hypothetical protein
VLLFPPYLYNPPAVTYPEARFHQEWLGLIQPSEGLVVSIPVLVDAQCMASIRYCRDAGYRSPLGLGGGLGSSATQPVGLG